MKKTLMVLSVLLLFGPRALADEGMWLLPYLNKLNIRHMQERGLKITAEDIYSANRTSLKDAVVIFGGGCTGEIISDQGLLMTNYHCGYGQVQSHSSVEKNYLEKGFWALSKAEEIPNPGLSVTFVESIEDVTDRIVPFLNDQMTETERAEKVSELGDAIVKEFGELPKGHSVRLMPFMGGNQYFVFVYKIYSDVRLVGAPPSSIGKFGGDTDNWMWPRHKSDFCLFRVYADKDGNPAPYSADNVPLKPKKHFQISLKGVEEGDFVMVMGFPGSTNRYMTSWEVDETVNHTNPVRIFVRGERQEILMADMLADPKVYIQYTSKYSGSSNYWKNSIGMNRGLTRLKVKEQKEDIEARFTDWVNADPSRKAQYGQALPLIENAVKGRTPHTVLSMYISEALIRGIEILSASAILQGDEELQKNNRVSENAARRMANFFKDYNEPTDRKAAKKMLRIFTENVPAEQQPSIFADIRAKYGNDTDAYVDDLFDHTLFTDSARINAFIAQPSVEELKKDPVVIFYQSAAKTQQEANIEARKYNDDFRKGHRLFIRGLTQMDQDKVYYPDANFSIRLTYGNVLPYQARDAVTYGYYTTIKGVLEKEDPGNPYEFTVPEKLKELYAARDFGPYAYKDDVPVGFIANTDITGGNSGSPTLNAYGQLVGTAFDGNWEAMSGDIAFEPDLQRTIVSDIRYILFIIDKIAGATHLIEEMDIVR